MKIEDVLGDVLFIEPLGTIYAQDDKKKGGREVPVREIVMVDQRYEISVQDPE